MSESFIFMCIVLIWGHCSIRAVTFCLGGSSALTVASLCRAQAVFRIQPQIDIYSEC